MLLFLLLVVITVAFFFKLVSSHSWASSEHDYMPRIGRTGRAGQKGYSLTLLTKSGRVEAGGVALCYVGPVDFTR